MLKKLVGESKYKLHFEAEIVKLTVLSYLVTGVVNVTLKRVRSSVEYIVKFKFEYSKYVKKIKAFDKMKLSNTHLFISTNVEHITKIGGWLVFAGDCFILLPNTTSSCQCYPDTMFLVNIVIWLSLIPSNIYS